MQESEAKAIKEAFTNLENVYQAPILPDESVLAPADEFNPKDIIREEYRKPPKQKGLWGEITGYAKYAVAGLFIGGGAVAVDQVHKGGIEHGKALEKTRIQEAKQAEAGRIVREIEAKVELSEQMTRQQEALGKEIVKLHDKLNLFAMNPPQNQEQADLANKLLKEVGEEVAAKELKMAKLNARHSALIGRIELLRELAVK